MNKIKEKAKIEDVMNRYVELKEAGVYLKGKCFDCDSESLTVTPSKQIFYCFGCKQGGDIISFIALLKKVSQIEALRKLEGYAHG